MTTSRPACRVADAPRRVPGARGSGATCRPVRRAFTLVELLVAISIIIVLMGAIATAAAAARGSQKKLSTKALIAKLDAIIQQQYFSYAGRSVAANATAASAAAARRQMASADMPDSWAEVLVLKGGTTSLLTSPERKFPLNAAQRAYVGYYNSVLPTAEFEDAECLFMMVMLGGLADCLDCGGLGIADKGDKDGDKAPEFWDAWGNPIGFILWPAGLEIPPGTKVFSPTAPFSGSASAGGRVMRPLIYSRGPDKGATLGVASGSHIQMGASCGDPQNATVATFAAFAPPSDDPTDRRADNITNLDSEVKP